MVLMVMVMVMVVMVLMVMVVLVMVVMLMAVFMVVLMHMVMVPVQAFLLLPVDKNRHMRALNAAFFHSLRAIFRFGKAQRIQPRHELLRLRQQFQQRCGQHIARSAHIAFQIECLHACIPF